MYFVKNLETVLKDLATVRKAYSKVFTEMFNDNTYSPNEISILIFLYNNPLKNTNKDLYIYLDVSKSLICRSIDNLQKKELIDIKKDELDKRIQRISLTKKSDLIIEKISSVQKEITSSILTNISFEEIHQAQSTIRKILDCFNERLK